MRPWQRFLMVLVIVGGFAVVMGAWGARDLFALLAERSVWANGQRAVEPLVMPSVGSRRALFVPAYDVSLTAIFKDGEGRRHSGTIKFSTILSKPEGFSSRPVRFEGGKFKFELPDGATTTEVRYDPKRPEVIAVQASVEAGWPRWSWIALRLLLAVIAAAPFLASRELFFERKALPEA
jgi:hypothetical protein